MFFILCVSGCSSDQPKIAAIINLSASPGGDLPVNPLRWRVITSEASTADSTQSTLFGNDIALEYARTSSEKNYPNGATLAFVTWAQQEDPRWFGAKIPERVKSVEFVYVGEPQDGHPSFSYERYEGTPLKKLSTVLEKVAKDRTQYLLSQRAAVMP